LDIQEETYNILGQRILPVFDSKVLVNWAVRLLENGYESESSIILAGLDRDSTDEREKYFWKSIAELDIQITKTDSELVDYFVKNVAEEVVKGTKKPSYGLNKMRNVLAWSGYDSKYLQFFELEEDVDYLENYGGVIFTSGLRLDNKDQFVKDEFELFLEIERLEIDIETREKSICNKCGAISKPILKNKYQLKKPHKYQTFVCGHCASEKIEHFSTQNGKRRIIDRIKNHT
jgi:RNase P subunit RPR2